jgi:hypothetical protein
MGCVCRRWGGCRRLSEIPDKGLSLCQKSNTKTKTQLLNRDDLSLMAMIGSD